MIYKRINDIFPEWVTNGIFTSLNVLNVPWRSSASDIDLNVAYHGSHSGDKIISPLVERMLTNDTLTSSDLSKIVSMLFSVNNANWTKLWNTLSFDYNPIENYSMTETESSEGSTSGNGSISESDNSSSTQSNNATNNNGVYGFNSTTAVNSDSQNGTATSTTSDVRTGTQTNETTGTHSDERTLTRSGNIGVMSSQQMITQERELWNWYFYDVVFKDIDKFLTLSIY